MKDHVKCNWCDFVGLVDCGEDTCPSCGEEGFLAWVDENKQEVEDNFLSKEVR